MTKLSKSKNMKIQVVRRLVRKAFLVAFIVFSFLLVFVGKPDSRIIDRTGGLVVDLISPVIRIAAWPVKRLGAFLDDVEAFGKADAENERLAAEISRLTEELNFYKSEQAEYLRLRQVCNFAGGGSKYVLITRILGVAGAGLSHTYVLDAGAKDGVEKYHAVMVDGYLVGQVVAVGRYYSRMLAITDASSRMPVQVERTGTRAFLAGDGSRYPAVVHFENQEKVEVGDRISTSGMDGNIPRGIPVGVVGSVSEEKGIILQPFVDASKIDYVKVIKTSHTEDIRRFLEEGRAEENLP